MYARTEGGYKSVKSTFSGLLNTLAKLFILLDWTRFKVNHLNLFKVLKNNWEDQQAAT